MILFIWDRDNTHLIMLDFKVETYITRSTWHDCTSCDEWSQKCDQAQLIRGRLAITQGLRAGPFFFPKPPTPPPLQPPSDTWAKFIIQHWPIKKHLHCRLKESTKFIGTATRKKLLSVMRTTLLKPNSKLSCWLDCENLLTFVKDSVPESSSPTSPRPHAPASPCPTSPRPSPHFPVPSLVTAIIFTGIARSLWFYNIQLRTALLGLGISSSPLPASFRPPHKTIPSYWGWFCSCELVCHAWTIITIKFVLQRSSDSLPRVQVT